MRYAFTSPDALPYVINTSVISAWVRADGDDLLLDQLVRASMRWAEGYCDQPLFFRSLTVSLTDFSTCGILSGVSPQITGITYDTTSVSGTTLDPAGYQLLSTGLLRFVSNSVANLAPSRVTITYTAGYTLENLPEDILMALLMTTANMYDNRSNPVGEKRTAAENLLQPYKIYSV